MEYSSSVYLPKFIDKVIFTPSNGGKSYVVSQSYKGILRISPNNGTSIYESQDAIPQLTSESDQEISYTDAVVPEESGALGDASIENRFIRVSDSEGHFIGLRIGNYEDNGALTTSSPEFDTLNVIGKVRPKSQITLYSKAKTTVDDVFVMNDTAMPAFADTVNTTPDKNWKCDMLDLHISQNEDGTYGDNTTLLYGISGDKRRFTYGLAREVIGDYVMEALMSLNTVPTGSVHFVPITIEQYKLLLAKGTHNRYYSTDDQGKQIETDPIVRDYLLCDGRLYKTRDFPELARVLWGEKIEYWSEGTNLNQNNSGNQEGNLFEDDQNQYQNDIAQPLYLKRVYNGRDGGYQNEQDISVFDYEKNISYDDAWKTGDIDDEQWGGKQQRYMFRVPDLRGMFIKSVMAQAPSEEHYMANDDYDRKDACQTGTWMPDNMPYFRNQTIDASSDIDRHFHFTHFGSYNNWVSQESLGDVSQSGKMSIALPRSYDMQIWYHGYERQANCRCGSYDGCEGFQYTSYFTVPHGNDFDYENYTSNKKPVLGTTTTTYVNWPIFEGSQSVNWKNGTDQTSVSKKEPKMKYWIETRDGKDFYYQFEQHNKGMDYGLENAPVHIICVPLIKI